MKPHATAAAAVLLLLGSGAQAQMMSPSWYGEVGYTSFKIDAAGSTSRPGAIRAILGYEAHPMFAIEGMAAGGVVDDDTTIASNLGPANANVEMKYMYGIWAKPRYVMNQFEVFARLGWTHTKVDVSSNTFGVSRSDSDDDFSWGLGANFRFNPRMYVGLDWMRYTNQSGNKIDGVTISFGYHW